MSSSVVKLPTLVSSQLQGRGQMVSKLATAVGGEMCRWGVEVMASKPRPPHEAIRS